MKLYRNALLLLLVLALLAAVYFVSASLNKPETGKDNGTTADTIKIFTFDSSKAKSVSLKKTDETFRFEKKDNEWKAVVPADLVRLDTLKVENIASTMGSLTAAKVIEEKASDLSAYGLDKPSEITVTLEDKSSKVLEIGSQTPTGDGYYVREKNKDKVYSITSYDGNALVLVKNDFKVKNLYDIKQDEINKLTMEKNGKLLFSAVKLDENKFELTKPIKAEADMEAIMTMLQSVEGSSITNFIEEKATDFSKYGLDKPAYTIEVETKSAKKKLLIGDEKEKNAELYARFADSNEVFTVGVGTFIFLDKPLTEISDRFIYLVDIKNAEELKVEFDGKTINSKIQADAEDSSKDRFWVDGKEVTNVTNEDGDQLFRKFYQSVIGVLLTDIKPDEKPVNKAEIRFTYKMKKDPKNMVIEFVPRDKYSYYAMRNGEYTGLVVEKKRFDEYDGLRAAYKALKEGMDKQK